MHIDLDLKLMLNGSAVDNEHQLALALRNLAHFLTVGKSANASVALSLQTAPPAVTLVETAAPQIVQATELLTLTVAEPVAPVAEPVAPEEDKSSRLPFEEYDRLVRSEMKRLSRNGIMPGPVTWNDRRDRRLPTLQAVVYRYGFKRPEELANKLGYLAPERIKATAQPVEA
jgi:hypothetical protein